MDVGEDAVLLSDSHVNLLVSYHSLSLLLALKELLLSSVEVSVVDVRSVLGIGASLVERAVGLLLDLVQQLVKLVELILELLLSRLLDRWAEDLSIMGLKRLKRILWLDLTSLI